MLQLRRLIRKRMVRLQLVLTAFAFLFGGIENLENGNTLLATAHFLMVLLNILGAAIVAKHPFRANVSLYIMNAVFASVLSYFYYRAGNDKMAYAWAIICAVSFVGCAVFCVKSRRQNELPD